MNTLFCFLVFCLPSQQSDATTDPILLPGDSNTTSIKQTQEGWSSADSDESSHKDTQLVKPISFEWDLTLPVKVKEETQSDLILTELIEEELEEQLEQIEVKTQSFILCDVESAFLFYFVPIDRQIDRYNLEWIKYNSDVQKSSLRFFFHDRKYDDNTQIEVANIEWNWLHPIIEKPRFNSYAGLGVRWFYNDEEDLDGVFNFTAGTHWKLNDPCKKVPVSLDSRFKFASFGTEHIFESLVSVEARLSRFSFFTGYEFIHFPHGDSGEYIAGLKFNF